ncbi:hypothetical protein OS493_019808 [Desmophyllum pertusum]|uniref:Uncharacterized protein n=1 Tax=Desmophyllum pertusum TaxID=174260 RepID=A0A9W9YZG6_9CNID|nr:hypothetical protein OS493_019808 [Desmophyllum pertusum]
MNTVDYILCVRHMADTGGFFLQKAQNINLERDANYTEFRLPYLNYPNFIRGRMGWTVNQVGLTESWPLEFLVKFSLGFYRQYDYLKVLNVGLEPTTHISLYSDKLRQIFLTARARAGVKPDKHGQA